MNHPNTRRLALTLLGIGGAFDADHGLSNTNGLVEIFEGDTVVFRALLDCGHTCGRQLGHLGLTYKDIDVVLVTHSHGDHIDGLEVAGYKNLFLYQHRTELVGPNVVLDAIWEALAPKMKYLQLEDGDAARANLDTYFDTRPTAEEGGTVSIADGAVEVSFIPVRHVVGMPAYAILLTFGADRSAPTIRWSGDTTFDADSPLFVGLDASRNDTVFHDCIFHPRYTSTVHTHLDELQSLPEAARKHICLVHHGKVTEGSESIDLMDVGQPLQRFEWPL